MSASEEQIRLLVRNRRKQTADQPKYPKPVVSQEMRTTRQKRVLKNIIEND